MRDCKMSATIFWLLALFFMFTSREVLACTSPYGGSSACVCNNTPFEIETARNWTTYSYQPYKDGVLQHLGDPIVGSKTTTHSTGWQSIGVGRCREFNIPHTCDRTTKVYSGNPFQTCTGTTNCSDYTHFTIENVKACDPGATFYVRGKDKTAGWEWYRNSGLSCGNVKTGSSSYEDSFVDCKKGGGWERLTTTSTYLTREKSFNVTLANAIKKGNPIAITLTPKSTTPKRGTSTTISWNVSNAHTCTATSTPHVPTWVGDRAFSGTAIPLGPFTTPGAYKLGLTCTNSWNNTTVSKDVTINVQPHAIALKAITADIKTGQEAYEPVTLSIGSATIDGLAVTQAQLNTITWTGNGLLIGTGSVLKHTFAPGSHNIVATLTHNGDKGTASRSITLLPNTPHPTINLPINHQILDIKENIQFVSSVQFMGAASTAAALTWRSSINGVFGGGARSFSVKDLAEGVHSITLTAVQNGQTKTSEPVRITIYDREKNLGDNNDGQICVGNPINIFTGNKIQRESDFSTNTETPLYLERVYNSYSKDKGLFGYGWTSNFDQKLKHDAVAKQVAVIDETGAAQRFSLVNNLWVDVSSQKGKLVHNSDGSWVYTLFDTTVKRFNAAGQITGIQYLNKQDVTFTYASNRLSRVVDEFGNQASFTFNAQGYVDTVTDPDKHVYRYYYQGDNLQFVHYPDATPSVLTDNPRKQYHYENATLKNALTGITDEDGKRFATWKYDSLGRAWWSEHAGKETEQVTYNIDGSVSTTNQRGRTTTYTFAPVKGIMKVQEVEGDQTLNCAAAFKKTTYDPATGFAKTQTDWKGNLTETVTNAFGQVTQQTVHDSGYGWATMGFGSASSLTFRTETRYDAKQLPWQIIRPGLLEERIYTPENRIRTVTLTDQTTHTLPYSTKGQKRVWTYTYVLHTGTDIVKTITIDGPRADNDRIVQEFNLQGYLVSVKNGLGHEIRYQDYTAKGLPRTRFDANNLRTTYVYDERSWLRSETVHAASGPIKTDYTYYNNGLPKQVTHANGVRLTYEYNSARHLTAIVNNLGERQEFTPENMTGDWESQRIKASTGAVRFTASRVFDELGRVIQDNGANGQIARHTFDLNGNAAKTSVEAKYTGFAGPESAQIESVRFYDALNRLRVQLNADEAPIYYGYDAAGNLSQVLAAETLSDAPAVNYQYGPQGEIQDAAPAARATASYQFSAAGRLSVNGSGTPKGQLTEYVYNGFGEKIHEKSPATGSTTYYRDVAGNLQRIVRADSSEVAYITDVLNRITDVLYVRAPIENVKNTYDTAANGKGRLATVKDQSGGKSYAYTDIGGVDFINYTIENKAYRIDYNYDKVGQLASIVYPTGRIVSYQRDALARIKSISAQGAPQGAVTLISNATYEPFGPLVRLDYGNGLSRVVEHDQSYRADAIEHRWASETEIADLDYDTANRIREQSRSFEANGNNWLDTARQHDYYRNGRLKATRWTAHQRQPVNPLRTYIEWDYDIFGNRTVQRSMNSILHGSGISYPTETINFSVNKANNQLKSVARADLPTYPPVTYDHTVVGNLTGELQGTGGTKYDYNQAKRIVSVKNFGADGSSSGFVQKLTSNLYNASGERVRKAGESDILTPYMVFHYHYDLGGALLAETDQDGALIREYVYLNGIPVAMFGGDKLYSYNSDTLFNSLNVQMVAGPQQAGMFGGLSGNGEISASLKPGGGREGSTALGLAILEDQNVATSAGLSVSVIGKNRYAPIKRGGVLIPRYVLADQAIEVKVRDRAGKSTIQRFTYDKAKSKFKLVRNGQYIQVLIADDKEQWAELQQFNVPLSDDVYIGAVASNTNKSVQLSLYTPIDHIYFIHPDHLGSPYAATSTSKNIVWQYRDFDRGASPFGANQFAGPTKQSGKFQIPLRFPGQYWDRETGLHYNYYRDYNPATGRYIQSDPIGLAGGVNTYSYAMGNPIHIFDQFGLAPGDTYPNALAAQMNASRYIKESIVPDPYSFAGILNLFIGVDPTAGLDVSIVQLGEKCYTYEINQMKMGIGPFPGGGASAGSPKLLKSPIVHKHHIFNKFRGNSPKSQSYRDFFKKHGIDVDQHAVKVTENSHRRLHQAGSNWTTEWKKWIDANPNASTKEVYQNAGRMMDLYGISHMPIIPY